MGHRPEYRADRCHRACAGLGVAACPNRIRAGGEPRKGRNQHGEKPGDVGGITDQFVADRRVVPPGRSSAVKYSHLHGRRTVLRHHGMHERLTPVMSLRLALGDKPSQKLRAQPLTHSRDRLRHVAGDGTTQ